MKKLLTILSLVLLLTCVFAISVSAETPSDYIEFGARFEGSDSYITVYTQNAESDSHPRINFKEYKFYSDVDFTQEVDMTQVTGLDFSVTKVYGSNTPVNRMNQPASPFTKCTEVKWFTQDKAMDNAVPTGLFKGFTSLNSFDFGNATSLGDNAFENTGFESIVIPSTVNKLYNSVFAKCQNLVSVKFEGNVTSIGTSVFSTCPKLANVDLGSLTTISGGMFYDCDGLVSITIPDTVQTIGNEAFTSCGSLATVKFSENLTSLGSRAFEGTAVTTVALPSTLKTVSTKAFYSCGSLTSVTIPAGFTLIDDYAFQNCKQLTTVTFMGNAGENAVIDQAAFENCSALVALDIPYGVTTLGNCVCNSSGIKTLSFPSTLTTLNGNNHFCGNSLESVTGLENTSITLIPSSMFRYQSKWQVETVKLPSTVKSIGQYGFADCGAENFILSVNLETIGTEAFVNCGRIKAVYLPSTLTSITANAFNNRYVNNICFFVTSSDETYLNTVLAGVKADDTTDIVTLEAYNSNKDAYASGRHVISGYALCDAFYNGAHEYSEAISYVNYYTAGSKIITCNKEGCTYNQKSTVSPLFVCLGTSTMENDANSMTIGFVVNKEAISAYEENTGKEVTYGVFAVAQGVLGESDIFDENGNKANGVISWKIYNQELVAFELKIIGLETDAQKSAKIAIGAYVKVTKDEVTEYSYIQEYEANEGDKYFFASFNDLFGTKAE
ncbi:MAG: leucine-rich repeat domain-containing protein [Clostridia bacterium]|nr:leucine-rich repeat domain-containing protein [Clostridia bacterium]